jgi:hypothetical protein
MSDESYTEYYKQLEGATILHYRGMQQDEHDLAPFPVFLVKFADGSIGNVAASMDEEGNGGGFIFIEQVSVSPST